MNIFNFPNLLIAVRIILSLFIIYFIFYDTLQSLIFAFILFIIASITDFFDGYLARKLNQVTKLGKIMDPTADKFLILGCFISFSLKGVFSFWWIVPIIIREILITYCRVKYHFKENIASRISGKIKTTIQIITISVIFLESYLLFFDNLFITQKIVSYIMYFLLALTNIITIYSAISFMINLKKVDKNTRKKNSKDKSPENI